MNDTELARIRRNIDRCRDAEGEGRLIRLVGDAEQLAIALQDAWDLLAEKRLSLTKVEAAIRSIRSIAQESRRS